MNGETKKASISALREQTALAKTRLYGGLLRFASSASRMMKAGQQLPVLIAASLTMVGCASTRPTPEAGVEREQTPAPVVREAPRPATTPVRASFQYAAGTVSYIVNSSATITELDSASAPLAFQENARMAYSIAPANDYSIVTASGSVETQSTRTQIRQYIDTLRAGDMAAVTEPRMPICGRDTVPPMHLVTLLPPVPPGLREGLRWQRRLVYGICQGAIPVRVERIDSYIVTGRSRGIPGNSVPITRNSTVTYRGSGVEGQHNVRVTGSGLSEATLLLDSSAGRLISATDESNSEIHITTSGRTRRFSQRIARKVDPR